MSNAALEALKAKNKDTPTAPTVTAKPETKPEPEVKVKPTAKVEEPELKFQHYSSALISTQLVTKAGKSIKFNNFEFITSDKDCIEYLNSEIEQGLKSITKGELLTQTEANPMERLKGEIIAKYLEDQKAAAKTDRNFGKTEGASNTNPATTNAVAS